MLLVRGGVLKGTQIALTDVPLVLGRGGADVDLGDPRASRRHAAAHVEDGVVVVQDLGSLNGTWVGGDRIDGPTALDPGAVVRLGDTPIEVVVPTPATIAAPGPAETVAAPPAAREAPPAPAPPAAPPPAPDPVVPLASSRPASRIVAGEVAAYAVLAAVALALILYFALR